MIQYAPVTINSGVTSTTNINGYPDSQAVVIYNESPFFINVSFVGSGSFALAAYTADVCPLNTGFTGTVNIMPSTYLNNTNSNPPASSIYIQSYGSNDLLTKNIKNNVSTGYPLALVRQVTSDVSNATSVTNVGYPATTAVVYGQVAGDTQGSLTITNDGLIQLGDATYPGRIIIQGSTGILELLDTGIDFLNSSSITTFSTNINGDVVCANGETEITFGAGNETRIVNLAGSDIAFYQTDTTHQIGRITNAGTFKFGDGTKGSITAMSHFGSYAINNVMTYYNHNLGVVPDLVLLQLVGNNLGTCNYDDGTMTTTQVKIAGSVASGLFVRGMAIKF